ncbi:unnamed protein product [Paramecium sonneborni]|uniref:Transmembrane protein n=1 Tax=Paramecium sonneborni TaxID=65129 RepID=A0A8S1R1Y6_9CILI|nr:unnamed protein product [Paramecium sonneborni]
MKTSKQTIQVTHFQPQVVFKSTYKVQTKSSFQILFNKHKFQTMKFYPRIRIILFLVWHVTLALIFVQQMEFLIFIIIIGIGHKAYEFDLFYSKKRRYKKDKNKQNIGLIHKSLKEPHTDLNTKEDQQCFNEQQNLI